MMINPAQFFAPVAGGYPFQDFAAQPTPTSGSDIKPPVSSPRVPHMSC